MNRIPDREYQDMMNSPSIQRALDERADAIKAAASARIKKVTGHTAESVAVEDATRDDGVQVRHVGYDLSKDVSGPYYEFGTEDTPPHPVLRVAAKSVK